MVNVLNGHKVTGKCIAVALRTAVKQHCTVDILNYTGNTVSVEYNGVKGNAPKTYQNFVAIWQGSIINLDIEPLKKQPIEKNNQGGSVVLDELAISRSSYTVAYGVEPELTTICATALLSAGGTKAPPNFVNIGLNSVGTTSLSINYQTLAGYLPGKYNNWIGLWEGYTLPYNAPEPLARADITSNGSQGDVGINDVTMKIKTEYTLVYFVGKSRTEAAALLNFNTADYAD